MSAARRLRCAIALGVAAAVVSGAVARDRAADRERPFAWREAVQQRDRNRLHGWRQAWLDGLAQARKDHGAAVAAEGVLLDPDAAENDPSAPDGAYRCRTIKLGGGNGLVVAPTVSCRIEGGKFDEIDGPQRITGYLWRYDGVHRLLLGALSVGDERGTMPYGRDMQRDVIGLFERIGPHRWRLAVPRPAWEAQMVVVEIVPAG